MAETKTRSKKGGCHSDKADPVGFSNKRPLADRLFAPHPAFLPLCGGVDVRGAWMDLFDLQHEPNFKKSNPNEKNQRLANLVKAHIGILLDYKSIPLSNYVSFSRDYDEMRLNAARGNLDELLKNKASRNITLKMLVETLNKTAKERDPKDVYDPLCCIVDIIWEHFDKVGNKQLLAEGLTRMISMDYTLQDNPEGLSYFVELARKCGVDVEALLLNVINRQCQHIIDKEEQDHKSSNFPEDTKRYLRLEALRYVQNVLDDLLRPMGHDLRKRDPAIAEAARKYIASKGIIVADAFAHESGNTNDFKA